jgi:hypothetical protein
MNALVSAASEILAWLHDEGWPCCVIGGLAVQRWGEPRLTLDVDLTVIVDLGQEGRFVDSVLPRFQGRRPDARLFAMNYRVLLVQASNGVPIDLALGATGFEIESITRATLWEVEPGHWIPTCSAEDLVVHKLVAGRPRDAADVEGVVARQADRLDVERIRHWLALFADIKQEPDMGRPLERALADARRRSGHGGDVL